MQLGPLMWMMPIHLHVNQKPDDDDDDDDDEDDDDDDDDDDCINLYGIIHQKEKGNTFLAHLSRRLIGELIVYQ